MAATHRATIRPHVNGDGWRDLRPGPGADHHGDQLAPGGEVVAVVAHLSDLHICDAESPARIEYLERHGLGQAPYRRLLGEIGTYRPQETLTVPVLIAMLEAVAGLGGGPLTGQPIGAAVLTGDLIDNAQSNELDWYLMALTGGPLLSVSGDTGRSDWVGAADAPWSEWFWHPEPHRSGQLDWWTSVLGFPLVPDLIGATRQTMISPGLTMPWFGVHGNHDLLLQGTVAPTAATRALAVGDRRMVDLAPDHTALAVLPAVARCGPASYPDTTRAPAVPTTPDGRRRLLEPGDFARRHHLSAPHRPDRGGPGNAFSTPLAPTVRLVAIDTVNPHGGWEGSLDQSQIEWLRRTLDEGPEPYVVIASHHPSWCLVNGYRPDGADDRVLADEVLGLLLDRPRVIVWVAGHVHHHSVTLHRRGERVLPEITAASLIDWPQQSRILEIVREPGGVLAVAGTAIDHAAPARPGIDRLDVLQLASLSRALAANAPRARAGSWAAAGVDTGPGRSIERNVIERNVIERNVVERNVVERNVVERNVIERNVIVRVPDPGKG